MGHPASQQTRKSHREDGLSVYLYFCCSEWKLIQWRLSGIFESIGNGCGWLACQEPHFASSAYVGQFEFTVSKTHS
jgi:hypothetical protein